MTSVATGIGVCCAVGLNLAVAFAEQTPPPPNPKPPIQAGTKPIEAEITVTGCLIQGSTASVFILQNAKRDPQSAAEKPARYVVVPATEDLFMKQHLNHQVRILGVPDGRPQPTPQAGTPVDEKVIPVLNAKGLTMVAAACGIQGGGGWSDADASSEGGLRHAGARKDRGGSIGLGSGGPGFLGSSTSLASTGGSAGGRFVTGGPGSLFGDVGFAHTSSVTGAFNEGALPTVPDQRPEIVDVLDWVTPAATNLFDGSDRLPAGAAEHIPAFAAANLAAAEAPSQNLEALMSAEPPSQPLEALMNHVARMTATELLGEDAPEAGLTTAAAALGAPIVNPEPGTLLLIASGLLLVVYAGRRGEWRKFGRRSAR